MDLPKGLVGDDERIHAELAKLTTIPLDAVMQFWKGKALIARCVTCRLIQAFRRPEADVPLVYTTTNKQLYDPTARRLENFWWHVWGSNRRNLRPETIAAIWHHISFGPSFVPLKGSPNRYEPPIVGLLFLFCLGGASRAKIFISRSLLAARVSMSRTQESGRHHATYPSPAKCSSRRP